MDSPISHRFLQNLMKQGKKKHYAQKLNEAMDHIRRRLWKDPQPVTRNPVEALTIAVEKSMPLLENVSVRRGARNIQTPTPMREGKRIRTAIKWIIEASDKQKGLLPERLASEIMGILHNDSAVLQKKDSVHKMALANKSNLHMTDRKVSTPSYRKKPF
jgi:ribosomal protein S7